MAANRSVPGRTATPTSANGSATTTSTEAGASVPIHAPILRLRAPSDVSAAPSRRIQWAEDVVDNEGMGKKSSKVCCIYHKPKGAGDSSSDDSSSSCSDSSDSEPDLSRAQPAKNRARRKHHHHDDEPCEGDHPEDDTSKPPLEEKARKPSPNAYERVPHRKRDHT